MISKMNGTKFILAITVPIIFIYSLILVRIEPQMKIKVIRMKKTLDYLDKNSITPEVEIITHFIKEPINLNCDPKPGNLNQFKIILFLSIPGSGNTWTRYLVEQATGYQTSSWFPDKSLKNNGFLGEDLDSKLGQSILIKNHGIGPGILNTEGVGDNIAGCLFVLRNPRDAILAEFTRRTNDLPTLRRYGIYNHKFLNLNQKDQKNAHMASLNPENFSKFKRLWKNTKTESIQKIDMFEEYYTKHCKSKIHFVHFEKLKSSYEMLESEIRKSVDFINSVNDQNLFNNLDFKSDCLLKNHEGLFHRSKNDSKKALDETDLQIIFTEREKKLMNSKLAALDKFLKNVTNDQIPESYYFEL